MGFRVLAFRVQHSGFVYKFHEELYNIIVRVSIQDTRMVTIKATLRVTILATVRVLYESFRKLGVPYFGVL